MPSGMINICKMLWRYQGRTLKLSALSSGGLPFYVCLDSCRGCCQVRFCHISGTRQTCCPRCETKCTGCCLANVRKFFDALKEELYFLFRLSLTSFYHVNTLFTQPRILASALLKVVSPLLVHTCANEEWVSVFKLTSEVASVYI